MDFQSSILGKILRNVAKKLGVKHVPEIYKGTIESYAVSTINWFRAGEKYEQEVKDRFVTLLDEYINRPDLIDPSHILEGVVVRFDSGFKFDAYKHKSWNFKVLEDIIALDNIPNMEDNQEIA
jgi:hypothetical protein